MNAQNPVGAHGKPDRVPVHGVLALDKPVGPSSQQVVTHAKRLFNAQKVGHGGTLDPLASGLLIVGFGEATKFLQRHLTGDKRYRATVKFGKRTSTGDAEGEVVETSANVPTAQLLTSVFPQFVGEIVQIPPQFSALKVDGKPAYARARAGETVALASRRVHIYALSLVAFNSADEAVLDVHCGAGTYIRTLAEDIAVACGSVAHLTGLVRTGVRDFALALASSVDDLMQMSHTDRFARLMSPDALLLDLPALHVSTQHAHTLTCGQIVRANYGVPNGVFRIYDGINFCGIADYGDGVMRVERWMSSPIPSPLA